jgi:hypothetical protein
MCYEIILSTDSETDLSKFNCEVIKFCKEPDDIPENQVLKYANNWYLESYAGCSCTFRFGYGDTHEFMHYEEWMNEDKEAISATKKFSGIVRNLLKQGSHLDCVVNWMGDGYKFSPNKKQLKINLLKITDSEFWFFRNHHLNFII